MSKIDELKRTMGANVAESASRREGVAIPAATLAGLNPARMDGVSRSKNALEIPIERIDRDPGQPREEFDEEALGRLADSIKAHGLLQPVRVKWSEEGGKYVLIAGERRWRASKLAGRPTLTCIVVEGEIPPAELLAIQVTENLQREDLNPMERARAFRTLMDLNGWSGNTLAKELGISQSSVVHALKLLDAPAVLQELVGQGALPPATAYEVTKIEDREVQAEVAARVVAENLSRSETVEVVRQASERALRNSLGSKGRGAKTGPPKPRSFRTPLGRLTLELKRPAGDGEIADMLLAIAEQLRGTGGQQGAA